MENVCDPWNLKALPNEKFVKPWRFFASFVYIVKIEPHGNGRISVYRLVDLFSAKLLKMEGRVKHLMGRVHGDAKIGKAKGFACIPKDRFKEVKKSTQALGKVKGQNPLPNHLGIQGQK